MRCFGLTSSPSSPEVDDLQVGRIVQPRSSVEFSYQSRSINFSEWVSLLTLCLAPLIAHIIAGVPNPVILQNPAPHWTARVCHYNPTSILWRYFVIVDRRARARTWTALDMAACNAEFWTGTRWNGSEAMITKTRSRCLRCSTHSRVGLVSTSTLKTVVITFQGVQACYALLAGLKGGRYGLTSGVHTIFFPLAVLGLIRLPAALWLSDEYGYACGDWVEDPVPDRSVSNPNTSIAPIARNVDHHEMELSTTTMVNISEDPSAREHADSYMGLRPMYLLEDGHSAADGLIHPILGCPGIATRVIFPTSILGLWVLNLLYFRPSTDVIWTAANLSVNVYYFFILTVTSVVITAYIVKGDTTTTIIPCISSTWYKVYTYVLFILTLILLVVSALETQRTPCGQYTTYSAALISEKGWMKWICP